MDNRHIYKYICTVYAYIIYRKIQTYRQPYRQAFGQSTIFTLYHMHWVIDCMSPFIVLKGRERFAVDYNEQKEREEKRTTQRKHKEMFPQWQQQRRP